jgi:hypothetical protein
MGRTGMSKKSKYLWKKIMILTWMFSLFLGILAGPCAIDAKNQKEKKDYGVFLSIDSSQIKKLYGYRLVVIDAQYFSAKDIRTLHKKGVKVYTYLNVGSISRRRCRVRYTVSAFSSIVKYQQVSLPRKSFRDHM